MLKKSHDTVFRQALSHVLKRLKGSVASQEEFLDAAMPNAALASMNSIQIFSGPTYKMRHEMSIPLSTRTRWREFSTLMDDELDRRLRSVGKDAVEPYSEIPYDGRDHLIDPEHVILRFAIRGILEEDEPFSSVQEEICSYIAGDLEMASRDAMDNLKSLIEIVIDSKKYCHGYESIQEMASRDAMDNLKSLIEIVIGSKKYCHGYESIQESLFKGWRRAHSKVYEMLAEDAGR